ncbi:hypothetical protein AV944_11110 [Sphingomonas sp. LK11]|uniref:hypothetical protein n=1 Tax=Sphingomonas sp. LK11 TaxID=1390395 RepID=UPI0009728361|nr:hypothetical protein [Sphingomonas sp. LK11]APX66288.1 hypothetical protein AV944_11110 [Sphingomonas sp. LK11]
MSTLISEIEAFTKRHGMSEWAFGEAALNDRHFIRQLRDGRDIRVSTLAKVQNFMTGYSGEDSAAA